MQIIPNHLQPKSKLVEIYLSLLNNLTAGDKLDIIAFLSMSIRQPDLIANNISTTNPDISPFFGAFESEKTADEIIAEIRMARFTDRKIEEL